ncbi:MAG: secondary thiamine-phosphate synthase enzyme YjbQ [Candidatus Micrarchaeota archaeon]|nr:secondary thiamine-phosphate synthase enzyme YjbQ [Candidatus Micrarchaeota archaeon]
MKEITINTTKRNQIINITEEVGRIIKEEAEKNKIKEGICLVYTPHATAALTINENWDESVCDDFLKALSELIPDGRWKHDRVDSNGAAHIKAAIIGPSVSIPVKDGRLLLGRWQGIMFCEFDGPRERKIVVFLK